MTVADAYERVARIFLAEEEEKGIDLTQEIIFPVATYAWGTVDRVQVDFRNGERYAVDIAPVTVTPGLQVKAHLGNIAQRYASRVKLMNRQGDVVAEV